MAERWFCSDHHIDHYNIIKYGDRPFKDVKEMNEALIERHNALVKPQDHVSFLGDVTIRRGGRVDKEWLVKTMKSYHGHKRLFLGNHDHLPIRTYLEVFEKIYATWRDEEGILYSHIPIHPNSVSWTVKANVHGHIHQAPSPEPVVRIDKKTQTVKYIPYVNVCVEVTDYRPITLGELKERIAREKGEWEGIKV